MSNGLLVLNNRTCETQNLKAYSYRQLQKWCAWLPDAGYDCPRRDAKREVLEKALLSAYAVYEKKQAELSRTEKVTNSVQNKSAAPEGVMREYDESILETMCDDPATEVLSMWRNSTGEYFIRPANDADTVLFQSFLPGEVKRWLRQYASMHPSKDQTPESLPDTLSEFTRSKFSSAYNLMKHKKLLPDFKLQLFIALGKMRVSERSTGKVMVESSFVSKILDWINAEEF
ncbi:MAG: hypothetical protein KME45_23185 [Stenomitos rutilans HA7619-LM2]|nr:hypothetical protein [Stenomitos rutilans HA7619-LM2]